jgi:hypothetical protein
MGNVLWMFVLPFSYGHCVVFKLSLTLYINTSLHFHVSISNFENDTGMHINDELINH